MSKIDLGFSYELFKSIRRTSIKGVKIQIFIEKEGILLIGIWHIGQKN
jgi:hypothetical protein